LKAAGVVGQLTLSAKRDPVRQPSSAKVSSAKASCATKGAKAAIEAAGGSVA
jgi:hypothetical protein